MVESTCIIEHLQAHHPGPNRWIPDGELGRRVRFLDRMFDLRVMANMQAVVFDALRPAEHRNPADRTIARERPAYAVSFGRPEHLVWTAEDR